MSRDVSQEKTPQYCPFCGDEFHLGGITNENHRERAGLYDCETHGEIEIAWGRMEVQDAE